MRNILVSGLFLLIALTATSQQKHQESLFLNASPLELRMQMSVKDIKKNTNDSTYIKSEFSYKNELGEWVNIKADIRARGEFRRKNCYFPPLRIKIKKADAKGTLFEGNRDLKLVLPCKTTKDNNPLIIKEYVCYKFYEKISPFHFQTRLTNIAFTETGSKNAKEFELIGFFIEDIDNVAKRHTAKEEKNLKLPPILLEDTTAIRHDLFQFMIGNVDFSTAFMHNAKILKVERFNKFIPVPYDFDMAGIVAAQYKNPDESLGVSKKEVREYRGFCRSNQTVLELVRSEYLDLENEFKSIISEYQNYLSNSELFQVKKYLDDFYTILKSDKAFKENIIDKCRTR